MIDSNTYNEIMRMCSGYKKPYTTVDVDNSPEKRQIENSAFEAELSEEERQRRYQEAIDYMNSPEAQAFYKMLRRHECNIFNALFKDKEVITEDIIKERVAKASRFFDLPIPTLIDKCDTLAKIVFSDCSELGSEIRYDIKKLEEKGINNYDAFDAMLTHELSHQLLAGARFNFCLNASWCVELACDFITGARCSANHIASGKYKYAVSTMKASETHPDGEFRLKAVKSGFDFTEWLYRKDVRVSIKSIMLGVNQFLCLNSKALNEAFLKFLTTPTPLPSKPIDVMDLPDNNLIKQYVLKYREQQSKKQNGS